MMMKKPTSSLLFWILWLVVSILSFVIGMSIFNAYTDLQFILLGFTVSGLLIGFGQWMILRTRMKQTWMWMVATALGLSLGVMIGYWFTLVLLGYIATWIHFFIPFSLAGFLIGTFQWIVLYKKLEGSFGWIMASTASWGIGMTFAFSIYIAEKITNLTTIAVLTGLLVGGISSIFVESALVYPRHRGIIANEAS